jgi:hypothetical protein
MKSLLHEHSGALPSSGLDSSLEVHIRRENTDSKHKIRTEQTMDSDGVRKGEPDS